MQMFCFGGFRSAEEIRDTTCVYLRSFIEIYSGKLRGSCHSFRPPAAEHTFSPRGCRLWSNKAVLLRKCQEPFALSRGFGSCWPNQKISSFPRYPYQCGHLLPARSKCCSLFQNPRAFQGSTFC